MTATLQPSFRGFEPSLDTIFLAIRPDRAAKDRIARLSQVLRAQHGMTGTPVDTDRLHVSLYSLGEHAEVPPRLLLAAGEAAAAVEMPPFLVSFDRAASFGGGAKRPLVLRGGEGIAGILMLHQRLGAALVTNRIRFTRAAFAPHVSLTYDRKIVSEQLIEPVEWTVREMVLLRSLHGQSRHVELGRWPLKG